MRGKEAASRANIARDGLIDMERKRLAKAKRDELAGANSENRGKGLQYLRPDGSPIPEEMRRAKSRERRLERKGKDAPPPIDGLRGEKTEPSSRFMRAPEGQW